ncbi:MAG: DUF4956 domain-containing protein [Candidatus Methanomethylophilaceae archaeon]|nr:DUF4956 domain-containing protein [Candidatus Methanomethylophilaceae archaeon]
MNGIFDSVIPSAGSMGPLEFVVCVAASLVMGFAISGVYMFRNRHSASLALTIALIPAIVCVVIMAVSGDIGAGIAVAGAFSLVRFRSAPGSAKEIAVIFLSMAVGLLMGMGFIAYSVLFGVALCLVMLACAKAGFGGARDGADWKIVKVTVPEDLDYNSEIDTLMGEYTKSCELVEVRSVNMGSMFRLTYKAVLKDPSAQKELIDKIRTRNGNLEVAFLREDTVQAGL